MEWRQIPGFTKYLVNEYGDVFRSYKCGTSRILKKSINRQGYVSYTLTSDDGYRAAICAHRAVALAFIPNPKGYGIVRHKDGNPANNSVENLEWGGCTEYERILNKKSRMNTYERIKAKMVSK